jgi:hypothetical protein
LPGNLAERLQTVCRKNLQACQQLLNEPELKDTLQLPGNVLEIFANDRLAAPNTDETYQAFAPALEALLRRLYPDVAYTLERETEPKERFAVRVRTEEPVQIDTLLERLAL